MNNSRENRLLDLKNNLEDINKEVGKLMERLEQVKNGIDIIRDDEEKAYDNLSESLQDSDIGENMQTAMEFMESAMDDVDFIVDNLQGAVQGFEGVYSALDDAINC